MKLPYVTLAAIIMLTNFVQTEITPLKVKTSPDFPEGPPPQKIYWEGVEVGMTNPGKSVSISIDIVKQGKTLSIGETKICSLWKKGRGFTGEYFSRDVKMKKDGTIVVTAKLSADEVLANAMEFSPIIQKNLNDADLSAQQKLIYNRLLVNILNYEFNTENIVASISGIDPEQDQVYLTFSYIGLYEKTWNDTLQLNADHFSGKKPKEGSRAQVFVDHFKDIQKVGVLKISRAGELKLTSIKTEKYKWGTYKKKKKKKKKYILPITFYAK